MPLPIIIVLAVLEFFSILGIGCFHYEHKHGHVVPEMPRYAGREKEWWWTATLTSFVIIGVAYVFMHVMSVRSRRKNKKATKK